MLRQVRRFLELHGEGRFTWWHRTTDDHNAKTLNRAGFRRLVNDRGESIKSDAEHQRSYGEKITPLDAERTTVEYFVLPEVFKAEVCQGFDPEAVCKVLRDQGCIQLGETSRFAKNIRVPGVGVVRCYHIPPAIFDIEI
jgi:putative DNA primase/helicase